MRIALYYYQYNVIHTQIYTEAPPNTKVTTEMVSFVAYRFRNRKVRWWLNVSTWQHRMCLVVAPSQLSLLLLLSPSQSLGPEWKVQ